MKQAQFALFVILMFFLGIGVGYINNFTYETSEDDQILEEAVTLLPQESADEQQPKIASPAPKPNSSSYPATSNDNEVGYNIQKKFERVQENYKNIKEYNLNDATSLAFEAEAYDANWAEPRELALENLMKSDARLHGQNVKSITCRSKNCRIEIFYNEKSDLDGVSTIINEAISTNHSTLFILYSDVLYSENKKIASIYITDDSSAALY
ncbi:MAG TPA: hypothetical protein VLC79_14495 [Cellvibrio sp.]|nr:hypothetical protein [Cellvibrio sp.]